MAQIILRLQLRKKPWYLRTP